LDVYSTEKEQIDQIKKWWGENGKAIIFGLVLGLGGLYGYRYWDSSRVAEGQNASINYEHLLAIASDGSSDEATEAGNAIISGYPKSTYAKLSALVLAKLAVDVRDLDEAKSRLRWVIENSNEGKIKPLAQARLAQLHLAEGKVEDAASIVSELDPAYIDQFTELRGDILLAQGQPDAARSKYSQALEDSQDRGDAGESIHLKIDNLSVTGQ
jgi:predicted negative regulator of RcsB-dependent stress response